MDRNILWVGMVEVEPADYEASVWPPNCGAYCTVVAMATNEMDYRARVTEAVVAQGFRVVGMEEIETLAARSRNFELPASLLALAEAASQESPVVLGSFHRFPLEGLS